MRVFLWKFENGEYTVIKSPPVETGPPLLGEDSQAVAEAGWSMAYTERSCEVCEAVSDMLEWCELVYTSANKAVLLARVRADGELEILV